MLSIQHVMCLVLYKSSYIRRNKLVAACLYPDPLNLSLDYDGTYKCFYYGNISRRETYFLILLHLMTFDVIVINPLKDEYWDLTDTDHLSEKITYSMIQEIRTLNERIANATLIQADESLTLHFEHQMDAEIYNNSGLYKAWQLRGYHVKQLLIRGNMIDISNNWNEPAKVRNGFDVKDKSVTIPHSFTVIDGITMDNSEYKSFVTGCTSSPECFTAVQKQDLLTNHMTENDSMQLTFFQLGDGTIDTAQLKEASFYPFAPYNDATEQFILDKMNELIRNPKILKTEQLSKKEIFQLVSTILNISKPLQRMIDNFDFSAQIPKLVYFLEDDKELDNDSSIILAYLNSIGFDIVVLSPAGTAGLETYLDEVYFDDKAKNHLLDRIEMIDQKLNDGFLFRNIRASKWESGYKDQILNALCSPYPLDAETAEKFEQVIEELEENLYDAKKEAEDLDRECTAKALKDMLIMDGIQTNTLSKNEECKGEKNDFCN